MERRWKRRPAGANWGEFGDDDQKGRLNWLTERKVLEGRSRFLLTAPPLHIRGLVGSPVNPVATV
ncbi:cyclase family protein [Burkholderia pseudomallei]|nr:cyclase family protein [Burkholderia pseudomallei]